MHPNTLKTLVAVGLLFLFPAIAVAAPPAGSWRGVVSTARSDVATTIRFTGQQGDVHFAEPFACHVTAKVQSQSGDSTTYQFGASANGGRFCDSLLGRSLQVTAQGGQLHVRFDAPTGNWQGELSQSGQ